MYKLQKKKKTGKGRKKKWKKINDFFFFLGSIIVSVEVLFGKQNPNSWIVNISLQVVVETEKREKKKEFVCICYVSFYL